ncbi:plasmodesmata-located protein 6 isoform X1 [Manihot esculenta]|uniref:plasmodesmata-located protein 6 isoform X1 n=1 Tax=Manihot esculenta TaxID=3983 RepID=UPI001CC7376D|nr:plasmodesmata-located protein 6 isoform X1 [Manihot esculenta]
MSLTITVFVSLLIISLISTPSMSSLESFVFGGCSQLKYISDSPYESNVNSLLTSMVNSASFTNYNNFTVQSPSSSQDTLYGLFQCRGDLSNGDCARCVASAVSQLGTLCLDSCGGGLQLDGCFVKFDNISYFGMEDKTVVLKKCGPPIGFESDSFTRRDAVLGYLGGSDGSYKPYRVGGSGDVYGVAQCVQDLSATECRDCVSDAIGRLKTDCGPAAWGDMYLAKCYVRFSERGAHSHGGNDNNNDEEIEKTLAILIGLIAGVTLLFVFLSCLRNACERGKGKRPFLEYISKNCQY